MEKARLLNVSTFSFPSIFGGTGRDISELRTEIIRKSIHFLIALAPTMAAINRPLTMLVLMVGTFGYSYMEYLRFYGIKVPVVSSLTSMASRTRDDGRFVLGPVTLGLGALAALLFYPSPAAAVGIYALAFGDGLSSLVGKFFGNWRPAFLAGKSVEGCLACFTAVLVSAYAVTGNAHIALVAAITATVVEALPLEDYDNLAIPVTVGLAVQFTAMFW